MSRADEALQAVLIGPDDPEIGRARGVKRVVKAGSVKRLVRVAIAALLAVTVLLGALLWYCTAMPGKTLAGKLPRATATEREVAEALRGHVSRLSIDIGPRRLTLGDSLKQAEAYIHEELNQVAASGKASVKLEPLPGVDGAAANLVLDLPGSKPGPIVLIGAHYDTAPGPTRGANDNGSGSAAALVLAARLATRPHALPIRVVLFANEEMPYFGTAAMGSAHHAADCRKRGEALRAMFSLETMGYYDDEHGSQHYPAPLSLLYPDQGNFIAFVGNLSSRSLLREAIGRFRAHATLPSEGGALPEALPGVGWSDHWAFWQQGYPAIMVTDTAPFRDPTYHRKSDIFPNLDFDRLARVVVALEATILELAKD